MKLRTLTMASAVLLAAGGLQVPGLGIGSAMAMDWLTPNLESQRHNNIRRHQQRQRAQPRMAQPRHAAPRNGVSGISAARRQQMMRRIEPEYYRRVRQHGKASADRWLKKTAWEMGVAEGRKARRQMQRKGN